MRVGGLYGTDLRSANLAVFACATVRDGSHCDRQNQQAERGGRWWARALYQLLRWYFRHENRARARQRTVAAAGLGGWEGV